MHGSNSGSLEWPHLRNDSLLQQGRSHGTASTLEKIFIPKNLQSAISKFRRRPSVKMPSEPSFPRAVGWLCFELLHGSRADLERHRRMGARTAAGAAVVVEVRESALVATQCWWLVFRWKGRRPSVRDSRNRAPVPGDAVLSGALPRPRWVGH